MGLEKEVDGWIAKLGRTFSSVLPIEQSRIGSCVRCGKCCQLPNKCVFLVSDNEKTDSKTRCSIYHLRPRQCRVYPRTTRESLIKDCGYRFNDKQ